MVSPLLYAVLLELHTTSINYTEYWSN